MQTLHYVFKGLKWVQKQMSNEQKMLKPFCINVTSVQRHDDALILAANFVLEFLCKLELFYILEHVLERVDSFL